MNIHTFARRARTAIRYGREHGPIALLQLIRQMLRKQAIFAKSDIVNGYGFIREQRIGQPIDAQGVAPQTINWFIPPVGRGSGGHLNIFRFVRFLEQQGFDCRIVVSGDFPGLTGETVESEIRSWFFPLKARAYVGSKNAPPAHITIATAWQTAYDVRNFQSTVHKCYFVQDFEPWFYASGSASSFAEETYRFGFVGITAGTWLAEMLAAQYGMTTHALSFSYDRELYRPLARKDPEKRRVFFYARPNTPRRSFELGMLVLDEVARRLPGTTIAFAGADLSGFEIPFEHTDHGIMDLHELPELYSQCDVALVLSFSNLSLLPLELMACGVPVVSNRAPYTEWLLTDENSRLEPPTLPALADAICHLLSNPEDAEKLRQAGLKTAHGTDWEVEGRRLGAALRSLDPTARAPSAAASDVSGTI
ncbi:glycosyltransferase family 4 protein [Achromobacter arsenitoxydans]|uniref:Glycosyl transferase group 1 n=1 Tax=Achromobacter arsenitoxydans SY8 TaxID=477184 RepID=H0F4D4_9BURK|nr:glycosyltransferase family 4 protein [Achromobacter arsenitoxydans]EHK66883.1 glycosyl transferase group 1 [Achromobacter arsenitoxydans SY8]